MAIGDIKPGYTGLMTAPLKLKLKSFDVNVNQSLLFYDHTVGMRDTIAPHIYGGKTSLEFVSKPQNAICRPSNATINGSLSFPLTKGRETAFFNLAKTGDPFDLSFQYYCGASALDFTGCVVDSYSISVESGGEVSCTVSIFAKSMAPNSEEDSGSGEGSGGDSQGDINETIYCWADCSVTGGIGCISAFSLEINNHCSTVFTAGSKGAPYDIRCGIQEIKGEISQYNAGRSSYGVTGSTAIDPISFSVGALEISVPVIFIPVTRSGSPSGPIISRNPFMAVGDYWAGS